MTSNTVYNLLRATDLVSEGHGQVVRMAAGLQDCPISDVWDAWNAVVPRSAEARPNPSPDFRPNQGSTRDLGLSPYAHILRRQILVSNSNFNLIQEMQKSPRLPGISCVLVEVERLAENNPIFLIQTTRPRGHLQPKKIIQRSSEVSIWFKQRIYHLRIHLTPGEKKRMLKPGLPGLGSGYPIFQLQPALSSATRPEHENPGGRRRADKTKVRSALNERDTSKSLMRMPADLRLGRAVEGARRENKTT
ncbi:hypothetical protein C8J57DRAFT_1220771 [Mycena rebaudengoi]|nr:hypothetical protein C8J57DRAFT_1220771 [Mycena rebaudengoi]